MGPLYYYTILYCCTLFCTRRRIIIIIMGLLSHEFAFKFRQNGIAVLLWRYSYTVVGGKMAETERIFFVTATRSKRRRLLRSTDLCVNGNSRRPERDFTAKLCTLVFWILVIEMLQTVKTYYYVSVPHRYC